MILYLAEVRLALLWLTSSLQVKGASQQVKPYILLMLQKICMEQVLASMIILLLNMHAQALPLALDLLIARLLEFMRTT